MRLNTFNEVAKRYEATKPVVSTYHEAEDNIRPIGQRKRKWERIMKVDAETYCLLDGNYGRSMYSRGGSSVDAEYEQNMAPIMWKREADGDYILIRNCTEGSASMSRYQFLQWYMPDSLPFRHNRQGKHWVHAHTPTGWEDFPLPKTAHRWDYATSQMNADDGKRLKFRVNEDGTFTRVGDAFKTKLTSVDRELKKEWKPLIEAFYVQAAALAPLIDTSLDAQREYNQTITMWCRENNEGSYYYNRGFTELTQATARQVVAQEDHPLRIPLMALMVRSIGGKRVIGTKEDLASIKSAYNRLMNKALGMFETKEV